MKNNPYDKYKETKEGRKKRLENTRKTYTRVIKPKKGKGSYDRSNDKSFQ
jgi:stalled ribosome alternative rescue factor ArfA